MSNQTETIANEAKGFNYYGLRVMTVNPLSNKKEIVNVGDTLGNSFDWADGLTTENELDGTCAVNIDNPWGELEADDIECALQTIKDYGSEGQLVLIGGNNAEYGQDQYEIIINNAVVLAIVA